MSTPNVTEELASGNASAPVSGSAAPKRTRAERKAARRAEWKRQEDAAADYRKRHPILSGAVKIVDYVPPGSKRLNDQAHTPPRRKP